MLRRLPTRMAFMSSSDLPREQYTITEAHPGNFPLGPWKPPAARGNRAGTDSPEVNVRADAEATDTSISANRPGRIAA